MDYKSTSERLSAYRRQIEALRQDMRQLQAEIEPEPVRDYRFQTVEGAVALSQLFGDRQELFVIHNMGTSCNACTLWSDGFNGVLRHLENRAAFAVSSPDDPATQVAFKASRGWRFRMVSHQGSSFAADMGFHKDGKWQPGVSVFRRDGDTIARVSDAIFHPGDDFCTPWHLFDLLPGGAGGWRPKLAYPDAVA